MPIQSILTAAASFFYAVSSLLAGAQNNAAIQQSLVQNYDGTSSQTQFLPLNSFSRNRSSLRYLESNITPEDENLLAKRVFTNLIATTIQNNPKFQTLPMPQEISFYDGEAIATLYLDYTGHVNSCRLIEVLTSEEAERTLSELATKNIPLEKADFRTMLSIITSCQALDNAYPPELAYNDIKYNNRKENLFESTNNVNKPAWPLTSGILPGTNWCGLGDIAKNYDDLGEDRRLDKCCRAHDHCPIKIKAFRSGYGLVNWSLYTKSHCGCDALLYDCLKKASSPVSRTLGNFYFNVLRVQCIDDQDAYACMTRDQENNCRVWKVDANATKYIFRELQKEFK